MQCLQAAIRLWTASGLIVLLDGNVFLRSLRVGIYRDVQCQCLGWLSLVTSTV